MIGYNPSHLNTNETLLEAFHRVEAYLKANPQYQVYQSSATYQEGAQEYALNTIVVPEGSTVGKGDVVLFSNVYYAVITAVSETTFSVETGTNFRGVQGEQGPKGDTGATGAKGETGLPALMYSKNVILGPSASFSTDLDGYNRTPQINDICAYYSSNTIVSGTIEEIRPDTQQVLVRKISILSTQGPRGESGPKGENGKDGNATLLYSGELSESITTAEISQVTRPKNRGILVKDILISTAASTFGAMAQVTALPVGVTTVTVSFIGTLQGESGGGGTTLNKYTYSTQVKSSSGSKRLARIIANCKGRCEVYAQNENSAPLNAVIGANGSTLFLTGLTIDINGVYMVVFSIYVSVDRGYNASFSHYLKLNIADNTIDSTYDYSNNYLNVIYYNDTEIT